MGRRSLFRVHVAVRVVFVKVEQAGRVLYPGTKHVCVYETALVKNRLNVTGDGNPNGSVRNDGSAFVTRSTNDPLAPSNTKVVLQRNKGACQRRGSMATKVCFRNE